ncbi:SDR family NAD(P)-dependent oxidoreductase [Corynebacterium uterequi]|uniref:3-oxoacyl-[acyl-carrier-protein] reductase n=1 Tax=Corynebacterium uterequi TaxID=1072256 RepID=A0A0G3HFG3_9CORY|nr:SDR family NAD(P)-dependent oxidoreductase [Corynebacterium uterequi]AKK10658.1 dehydrogenase of unknown specificity, short-chain alcohol dehydrogenase like [Corynebacterium uterequi]
MRLDNKVAIITGAGSGFGAATAELFAERGAKVVVVDINAAAAEAVAAKITEAGGEAISVAANVADEKDVQAFVASAVDTYGHLDILFNNAGVYVPGTVEETDLAGWEKSVAVNLTAVFLGMKYAMPHLKETKGTIISTASAGGIIGFPGAIGYAATKGGVISLTRGAAVDYARDGVRVNAIAPGTGVTGMTEKLLEDPTIKEAFLAPIPEGRLGEPKDVAHAALFLASDFSSYITGHVLPVDGGWTMS